MGFLFTTVHNVTIRQEGICTSTSVWVMDGVRIPSQPVARCSAEALDAYTERIVATFEESVSRWEKIPSWFAQAETSQG